MKAKATEGRFAYEGLDRVIHERARLSVLTSLVTNPKGLTFGDLKQLCSLTDGNLSRHLRVLERSRLVEIVKGIDRNNRPQTVARITAGFAGTFSSRSTSHFRLAPFARRMPISTTK